MESIIDRVITILNNANLNIDKNNIEADFIEENNIDSITFIELIIYIEEEFDILVPDEYLLSEKLNTVSRIANLIMKLSVCII